MCRVLLSGFSRLDAELLMKGLEQAVGARFEARYVTAEELANAAVTYLPNALLLGENLQLSDEALTAYLRHLPTLVIIQLSPGGRARLVKRGTSIVPLPEVSLPTLALLLCEADPGNHPKDYPPSPSKVTP
jgi:hypothetical protein